MMIRGLLRYLGLDEESRQQHKEMEEHLEEASRKLDQLKHRFEESSRISVIGSTELSESLKEHKLVGVKRH
jgi:hypothetical protein